MRCGAVRCGAVLRTPNGLSTRTLHAVFLSFTPDSRLYLHFNKAYILFFTTLNFSPTFWITRQPSADADVFRFTIKFHLISWDPLTAAYYGAEFAAMCVGQDFIKYLLSARQCTRMFNWVRRITHSIAVPYLCHTAITSVLANYVFTVIKLSIIKTKELRRGCVT